MEKPYRNAGKSWTPTEEEELVRNYQQYRGNMTEIAEVHGRSEIAIQMRVSVMIKRFIKEGGMSKNDVARLFFKQMKEVDDILKTTEPKKKNDEVIDRLTRIEEILTKILRRQIKMMKPKK